MTDRELNAYLNQLPVLVIRIPLSATEHLGMTIELPEMREGEIDETKE